MPSLPPLGYPWYLASGVYPEVYAKKILLRAVSESISVESRKVHTCVLRSVNIAPDLQKIGIQPRKSKEKGESARRPTEEDRLKTDCELPVGCTW
jgi:hypothetical protein